MNSTEVDVEDIVRRVMARLRSSPAAPGTSSTTARERPSASPELVLLGRLVTEQELARSLRQEKVVRVSAGAVVTPAARDFLNDRGVTLQVIDEKNKLAAGRQTTLAAIGAADTKFEPGGLLTTLVREGTRIEQVARTGLTGVVAELSDRVGKGGERGVLFTQRAATAVCLANRVRGVRAAAARNQAEVQDVIREVGANLLVINPAGQSPHALLLLLRACCVTPLASCPDDVRPQLD